MNPISGMPLHFYKNIGAKNNQEFNIIQWETSDEAANQRRLNSDRKLDRLDYATEERARREEENKRKMMAYNQKREAAMQREALRSKIMATEQIKSVEKIEQKRNKFAEYKAQSGLPYNAITLEYHNSERGKQLKTQDEYQNYKVGLRYQSLDSKRNSGFNIITGEPRKSPQVPPKPAINRRT